MHALSLEDLLVQRQVGDRTAAGKTDPFNTWVNQLHQRRGFNRATVAVANKSARIIWAVLRSGEAYHAAR